MVKRSRVEVEEGIIRRKTSSMMNNKNNNNIAPKKGHFVVYVGCDMTRFVVPMFVLKNASFKRLLDEAADEFGFGDTAKLVLPCDEIAFRRLIASIGVS